MTTVSTQNPDEKLRRRINTLHNSFRADHGNIVAARANEVDTLIEQHPDLAPKAVDMLINVTGNAHNKVARDQAAALLMGLVPQNIRG